MKINLAILTPVYSPAPGGGAQYTKMLSQTLIKKGYVSTISVFTERHPDRSRRQNLNDGRLRLYDIFPLRAGREKKDYRSYFAYLIQQIQILLLPLLLPIKTDILMVHSSFYLRPTTLRMSISILLRLRPNLCLIADVRDTRLDRSKYSVLHPYDAIIACSKGIQIDLQRDETIRDRIHHIPIIFSPKQASKHAVSNVLQKSNLQKGSYLFNGNGFLLEKGIQLTLQIVDEMRNLDYPIKLVIAGRNRDWNERCQNAVEDGYLVYVGILPNDEILAYLSGAALHINVSGMEGLPRGSLEAVAAKVPVLIPSDIVEFKEFCPHHIMVSNDPVELAKQCIRLIDGNVTADDYPVASHEPANVAAQYNKIFSEICNV